MVSIHGRFGLFAALSCHETRRTFFRSPSLRNAAMLLELCPARTKLCGSPAVVKIAGEQGRYAVGHGASLGG